MINIDAKVKDSDGEIRRVEGVYDDGILVSYGGSHAEDSDFLEHGTYTVIEDIRSDYAKQKQRADELEKRWDTLRRKLKYEYDTANNRTELRCFGMSLDIMHDLEENNNA